MSCEDTARNKHVIFSANGFMASPIRCELRSIYGARSQRLRLRVHELLHHQVDVDDGTEVERPVEEAVAHKLRDERPHEGEGEALR